MAEKFDKIIEEIETMSVLELSQLVKAIEEKFGVSAMQFAAPAASSGAGEASGAEVEKTSFNVVMTGVGENKIQVIKVVKDITGKGLKEAKDLVEAVPAMIKEGAKKEEAEELKKKLEEVGAAIELK